MMRRKRSYVDDSQVADILQWNDHRNSLDDSSEKIEWFLQATQYSVHSVKIQILECILLFIGELKRTYL